MNTVNVYVVVDKENGQVSSINGSRQEARDWANGDEKIVQFILNLNKGKVVR